MNFGELLQVLQEGNLVFLGNVAESFPAVQLCVFKYKTEQRLGKVVTLNGPVEVVPC